MKYRMIFVALLCLFGVTAYAAEDQARNDEDTVVGACMIKKFKEKIPDLKDDKIAQCAEVDAREVPKCLGIPDSDYIVFVKACVAQMVTTKCVAQKLKVPLIQYAECQYEKDPGSCYKTIGSSTEDVAKLTTECQSS